MKVRPVCLDAGDAVELGELLEFLGRWLFCEGDGLADSLARVVGVVGYDVEELRADVLRFAFLVGGEESWFDGDVR